MKEIKQFMQYLPKDWKKHKAKENKSVSDILIGISVGDIAGSYFEDKKLNKAYDYRTIDLLDPSIHGFTDDTVMSFAIFKAASEIKNRHLFGKKAVNCYAKYMRELAKEYPDAGYGANFYNWAVNDYENPAYQSYGDGSAMRSGVIGAVFDNPKVVIKQAVYSALPTHGHPRGIKGAVVVAVMVWMGLHGYTKKEISEYGIEAYKDSCTNISTNMTLDELVAYGEKHKYETCAIDCDTAVSEAIINFAYTDSYEMCLRSALRYMSDADTVMAISGGIAAAYYNKPHFQGVPLDEILPQFLFGSLEEIFSKISKL